MKLRFQESEITYIANKYKISELEEDLISLRSDVQRAGFLSKSQLRSIARWKAQRSAGHIEKNEEDYIREITSWAFHASEERSRIQVLTLLDGISWPSASAILHLYHRDPYPILDFRALWSLHVDVPPNPYSFQFWWQYTLFCRELSRRNGVDMRTLDRALWQYSKDNQSWYGGKR